MLPVCSWRNGNDLARSWVFLHKTFCFFGGLYGSPSAEKRRKCCLRDPDAISFSPTLRTCCSHGWTASNTKRRETKTGFLHLCATYEADQRTLESGCSFLFACMHIQASRNRATAVPAFAGRFGAPAPSNSVALSTMEMKSLSGSSGYIIACRIPACL